MFAKGSCANGNDFALTDQGDPEPRGTSGDLVLGAMNYVNNAYCELDVLQSNRFNATFTEVSYVPWPPSASVKEQQHHQKQENQLQSKKQA